MCRIYICGTKYDLIEQHPEQRAVPENAVKALVHGIELLFFIVVLFRI
jgi:hypothetical protein